MSRGTTVGAMSMLFGIGASSANAGVYEGKITGSLIEVLDSFDVPPGVVVGAPITLTYTFDLEAPDRWPENDTEGHYDLLSWSLEIGPEAITCLSDCQNAGGISTINDDYQEVLDFTYDMYFVNVRPATAGWWEGWVFSFYFVDTTASVFCSDVLPRSLELSLFDMSIMHAKRPGICLGGSCPSDLTWEPQALDIHAVPEPSTCLLLLAGGIAVLARKRRKTG